MAVHVRHYNVSLRVHGYVTRIIQLSVTIAKWTKLERLTCKKNREQYVTRCCKVKSSTLASQKTVRWAKYTQPAESAGKQTRKQVTNGLCFTLIGRESGFPILSLDIRLLVLIKTWKQRGKDLFKFVPIHRMSQGKLTEKKVKNKHPGITVHRSLFIAEEIVMTCV